jgi:tetratricopeptide (TPR) repeat protein
MRGSLDEALRASREGGGSPSAMALYFAGRYSQAAAFFERAASDDPTARMMLGACKLFGGDAGASVALFEGALSSAIGSYALAFQVFALGRSGEWLQARKKLTQIESASRRGYVSPMVRAVAHLGLGDREAALRLIEEAVANRDPWTAFMSVDPLLGELRGDPRFDVLAGRTAA